MAHSDSHLAVTMFQISIHAAYLCDAVTVYARALAEALREGIDARDGAAIIAKITGRTYESETIIEMQN